MLTSTKEMYYLDVKDTIRMCPLSIVHQQSLSCLFEERLDINGSVFKLIFFGV